MKFIHEVDKHGSHRIKKVLENERAIIPEFTGEWAGYQNYASLTLNSGIYIAVTEYFAGGPLVPETVYIVKKVEQ